MAILRFTQTGFSVKKGPKKKRQASRKTNKAVSLDCRGSDGLRALGVERETRFRGVSRPIGSLSVDSGVLEVKARGEDCANDWERREVRLGSIGGDSAGQEKANYGNARGKTTYARS